MRGKCASNASSSLAPLPEPRIVTGRSLRYVRGVLFDRRVGAWCLVASVLGSVAACGEKHDHDGTFDAGQTEPDAAAGAAGEGGTGSSSGGSMVLPGPDAMGSPCNGAAALCDKRFSALTFLGTHLSFASEASFGALTQGRALNEQLLVGGVRALELEIHLDGESLALCSGSCAEGSQSLAATLRTVQTFLDGNPTDVLTLVLRSSAPVARLSAAFDDAQLLPFVHSQPSGKPWPTLQQMIDAKHTLVVLLDQLPENQPDLGAGGAGGAGDGGDEMAGSAAQSAGEIPEWLHPLSTWAWETPADEGTACALGSGSADAPLAILNHYQPGEAADDEALAASHVPEVIATRLARCVDDRGHAPNFVLVDFAEVGDPNGGAQIANGLR